jgi:hypothetical protein
LQIDDIYAPFLSGADFSSCLDFKLEAHSKAVARDDYLVDKLKGKKVIHVGFVDHLPLIEQKINSNSWLHKKLDDVTELCLGIDINEEGVEFVKNNLGFQNVLALDILNNQLPGEYQHADWDYIILPDVIEHLGNPVEFLCHLKERFSTICSNLIVTTPNAFRYRNFLYSMKNIEHINSDHRFWFTPYTLTKLFSDVNLKVRSIQLVEHRKLPRKNFIKKYFLNKYPFLRDTLVMDVALMD